MWESKIWEGTYQPSLKGRGSAYGLRNDYQLQLLGNNQAKSGFHSAYWKNWLLQITLFLLLLLLLTLNKNWEMMTRDYFGMDRTGAGRTGNHWCFCRESTSHLTFSCPILMILDSILATDTSENMVLCYFRWVKWVGKGLMIKILTTA